MVKRVFVSPYNGNWKVKTAGAKKASGVYDTKLEAVNRAIKVAKNQKAELSVQNKNGLIGWKNSYGNDPRNIPG